VLARKLLVLAQVQSHWEDSMKRVALSLLLAAAPFVASAAPINLITNGSFEDVSSADGVQSLTPGTWQIFGSIPGWSSGQYGIEVRNNVAGTAYDGNHFIELDTTANSFAAQSIATVAGSIYDLTFFFSPRPGVTAATTNDIGVYWNGTLLQLLTGTGTSTHNWQAFSFSVIGTGSDTLRFAAAGLSDSYGGSLDMVSLTQAVPEPGTLALLMGGLLAALGTRGAKARPKKA
jgi:hypothetical protein